jgi:uncharacterized protein
MRRIENAFIPTPDGERLAVQVWAPDHRAPVVLESIPYRKRDRYRAYGEYWGRTLAERGIAYARLDVRGSGDSTGILTDEYLPTEQQDNVAAIAWLAQQDWCDGAVGMRGVSWGGFSTLQAAALRPPALKAIMPMCASDRRFWEDAHFVGGAFGLTGLKWATSFKMVAAGPPDPVLTADWLEVWKSRLAASGPVAARWLSHQSEDDFWTQGSVGFDPDAIACPVYLVGGLADPYRNFIPRLMRDLQVPRKALLGPWRHGYPSPAAPGPGLDWASEEARWWRQHLLGEETGVMTGPAMWTYLPERTAAAMGGVPLPGRWAGVNLEHFSHPPAVLSAILDDPDEADSSRPGDRPPGRLLIMTEASARRRTGPRAVPDDPRIGLGAAEWVPFHTREEPTEQSADDGLSLVFETDALAESFELLGRARLSATVRTDQPAAHLAARLCQVDREGRSWLVAYALLNLAFRREGGTPELLPVDEAVEVVLDFPFTAHHFGAGERIRLSLSQSLWPLVWPAPRPAHVELIVARLDIPRGPERGAEIPFPIAPALAAPEDPEAGPVFATDTDSLRETWPVAAQTVDGVNITSSGPNTHLTQDAWRARSVTRYERKGAILEMEAEVSLTATPDAFTVAERVIGRLDGAVVGDVAHQTTTPRLWS